MSSTPQNPENDPLEHLEDLDRKKSVKQAWQMALGFPIVTILSWAILDLTLGESLTTRLLPTGIALLGPISTVWVILHKWRRYQRWQPFMGTLWWLIPFFLIIFTTLPTPLIAELAR